MLNCKLCVLTKIAMLAVVAGLLTFTLGAGQAQPEVKVGEKVPAMTFTDISGKEWKPEDLNGKIVVLEWFNAGCPYVVHQHEQGPLKDMGNEWSEKGIVWIAINSGAPGKQGTGKEYNEQFIKQWDIRYPMVLDESGVIGKMFGARTTPQMVVINTDGVQVYNGAIDNAPLGKPKGGAFENHVEIVLTKLLNGETVEPTSNRSYGCSVKY